MARRQFTRYWHGGVPGLQPGDRVHPASQLAQLPVAHAFAEYDSDPDWVYVTVDRTHAKFHASAYVDWAGRLGGGDLYNVRPRGELQPDPDYPDGVSFSCRSAIVVVAAERGIRPTRELELSGLRYATWRGGGPMYDSAGHMLPSPEMVAFGMTAEDLVELGFGPDVAQAAAHCQRLLARSGQQPDAVAAVLRPPPVAAPVRRKSP
jgi:hypothetical protein